MGRYDVYCAICGAALFKPDIGEFGDNSWEYDRGSGWMEDVRIISEDPNAVSIDK